MQTAAEPFTGQKIGVLVVEDSVTVRARIIMALESDPAIEVIGAAADGETGIEMCQRLRPTVVTMDMMLPGMTGLAATQYLMQHCPTPILVISAASNRAGFIDTLAALEAGAVDVLEKPDGSSGTTDGDWDREFLATVKLVAKIRVITHIAGRPRATALRPTPAAPVPAVPSAPHLPVRDVAQRSAVRSAFSVVAIGASTGGPTAVAAVLCGLPRTLSQPILLVMHLNQSFGAAFASWLEDTTGRRVRLAVSGEPLDSVPGQVIMAPPGRHLRVRNGVLILSDEPERHSCRPSVDVLFESLAQDLGSSVAACLLTGMGRDGALGLLDIHRAGGLTIAQNEQTSVVFGMPGEAVRLGATQHILPIDEIGPMLGRLITGGER